MSEIEMIPEAPTQTPPKFVPSTADLPKPMDDNMVREIFANAARQGMDMNSAVSVPAPNGQLAEQRLQEIQPPKLEVPAKFQKPDGTADEEKIKASSAQLDEALKKAEPAKTVEEILADYKLKEKAFKAKTMESKQSPPEMPMPTPLAPAPIPLAPDMQAVRNQLLQLQQTDPIAFAVEIARAVSRKEASDIAAPALEVAQNVRDQARDEILKSNVAKLAESDPRFLQLYSEVTATLDSEPAYFNLKNPHKAAWNEVKERLRLGEPPARAAQAQPSMNPSLTLRGGSPTPVSQLSQPQTEASLFQQSTSLNPYSEEGKRFEDKMRELTRLGQGGWQST